MHKSNLWLAGKVLGDRVRNGAGENLGKIEELVIDPATGNILYAVLSFGGFLGMGNKLFAIPWTSLSLSTNRDFLLLDIDKEVLQRAPGFDSQHWPDIADPAWQTSINEYYGVSRAYNPVVTRTPVHAPVHERTVVVERERKPRQPIGVGSGLLILLFLMGLLWFSYLVSTRGWEQAKSDISGTAQTAAHAMRETSADAALTGKIRTAFSLSKRIPAGNINVDSKGDVVTLRGEVPTQEIRELAEKVARDVPGVGQVHNHLYVLNPQ